MSPPNPRRMSENNDDPDRRLLVDLRDALERAEVREERIVEKLDQVIGLARDVNRNASDIKEVHGDLYGKGGLMTRVEVLETAPGDGGQEDDGGIYLSSRSVVSIAIFLVGAALTGLWHIVGWLLALARQAG